MDAFWSLEMLGNGPEEVARDHLENHPTYKKFIEDYVKYSRSEQWYQVSILFSKDVNPYQMVNNVRSAQRRAVSLYRNLHRDNLFPEYQEVIEGYEREGFYEIIPSNEVEAEFCFYMPQQVVVKTSGQGQVKLRPVFDLSSRNRKGVSANDLMDPWLAMQHDIVGLLMRWRRWPVALSGDVEKAFPQLIFDPKNRDLFRFLLLYEGGE